MLELKKISKTYVTDSFKQKALDGISIKFRQNEFVSILGPSGSGKTTLLNIVGGLDDYNSGDLIINGISTKKYKDRDWDAYRNHEVGFVFQSYNLIPHQTILANVELALTLSGVSKSERKKRAIEALEKVGLKDHINKRPNQLSGGQMQRVAIARALVNDPSILLADEPTGALDSKTSTQIMDLLKEVAENRLVIMVTHNADLANEYSTRVIELRDGKITNDSNPYTKEEKESEGTDKKKKTNMSFITALSLSLNNLMTKKGRTILTALAGSIGIIGIALILSLSNGFQKYIDKLQEDTLSSYPLTIQSETMDFASMMISMMESSDVDDSKEGIVTETQQFADMFSSVTTNDLKSFKKYLEDNKKKLQKDVKSVTYTYSIDPVIYTKKDNEVFQINPNSMFSSMFGGSSIMSTFSSQSSVFVQYTNDEIQDLKDDYKIVEGNWPTKYNELVLALPDENAIPDLLLYMMGIRDMDELYDIMSKVMTGEKVEIKNTPMEFEYKDFLDLEYKLINKTDLYKYNKKYKIYEDMQSDKEYVKKIYENAESLKIVGVIAPKKDGSAPGLSGGIIYSEKLIEHIIDNASKTDIVKKQLENEEIDVFSNKRFDATKSKSDLNFEDFISIDTKMLQSAFKMDISENDIKNMTAGYMDKISNSITADTAPAEKALSDSITTLAKGLFNHAASKPEIKLSDVETMTNEYMASSEASSILSNLEKTYYIPANIYKNAFSGILNGILKAYIIGMTAIESEDDSVTVVESAIDIILNEFINNAQTEVALDTLAVNMTEAKVKRDVLTKVGELTTELMTSISKSFNVDSNKIARAFKFNMTEEEISRLMGAMNTSTDANASSNLINLGYQDLEEPTYISVRFYSFESKQNFLDVIDKYNETAKNSGEEDKVINYTDTTGVLMSSVKKIVDSVSYVLIAFVSIALIVSSIMIGIVTYISVLERTKEIGILRAIGASKKNISSIFNAETFIIGLLSGLIAMGFTFAVIPVINSVIHSVTNNTDINAAMPIVAAIVLIILSVILTLIGGLIPSRMASKKDPVEALRTE